MDTSWLAHGSVEDRFARVARHQRCFDMAMAETAYRYGELYSAGHDRNWEYASYQLVKIETAVALGVERRPRRAASARMLEEPIRAVRAAIQKRDEERFGQAFAVLTATCNACHQAERVPFIRIHAPALRESVVGGVSLQ